MRFADRYPFMISAMSLVTLMVIAIVAVSREEYATFLLAVVLSAVEMIREPRKAER